MKSIALKPITRVRFAPSVALAVVAVVAVLGIGCSAGRVDEDLERIRNATKLVLSPGQDIERRYEGEALKKYLADFVPSGSTFMAMISGIQSGAITIDGIEYPVEYFNLKAGKRPVITITLDGREVQLWHRVASGREREGLKP